MDDAKSNVNRKETCNNLLQVSICLLNWKMQISYRIAKNEPALSKNNNHTAKNDAFVLVITYAFISERAVKIKS